MRKTIPDNAAAISILDLLARSPGSDTTRARYSFINLIEYSAISLIIGVLDLAQKASTARAKASIKENTLQATLSGLKMHQ